MYTLGRHPIELDNPKDTYEEMCIKGIYITSLIQPLQAFKTDIRKEIITGV